MTSRQPARYIKRRMGDQLKKEVLARNGIVNQDELRPKILIIACPKCDYTNARDTKYCSKCSYPLSQEALEELRQDEKQGLEELVGKKVRQILERVDLTKLGSLN